jgi:hypothetical protein
MSFDGEVSSVLARGPGIELSGGPPRGGRCLSAGQGGWHRMELRGRLGCLRVGVGVRDDPAPANSRAVAPWTCTHRSATPTSPRPARQGTRPAQVAADSQYRGVRLPSPRVLADELGNESGADRAARPGDGDSHRILLTGIGLSCLVLSGHPLRRCRCLSPAGGPGSSGARVVRA